MDEWGSSTFPRNRSLFFRLNFRISFRCKRIENATFFLVMVVKKRKGKICFQWREKEKKRKKKRRLSRIKALL
jgi:hypothetical protein